MSEQDDVVAKTIRTYENIAEEHYHSHFDINEVKYIADFFIKNLKGQKVLDVGCGAGRDAKYFSEHGLSVTGIELAYNFIKIASKNAPNTKLVRMDMRKLGFLENSFDGVWACASFLHLPKKDAKNALLGFGKILKPGGLLCLGVKKGDGEKLVKEKRYKNKERFIAFYNEEELKNLVESCGFKIIKVIIDQKEISWIDVFAVKGLKDS